MARIYRVTVGRVSGGDVPPPEPTPTSDWGEPGNRPAITVRPDSTTTGARFSTETSMTGQQAMTAVLAAPVEEDGKRYLRRANITSALNLNSTGNNAIVFEDCVLDIRDNNSIYAISAFYQAGTPEPETWPEFRHCTIRGGTSATLRGGWVRLLKCDMSHGTDILKPFQALEVWGSYLHDCYRNVNAHCDIIQIVSGASGALFDSNNMVGYTSSDSPEEPNSWTSGVLQTGTVSGDIGNPDPVVFVRNWIEGGRFGFRLGEGGNDGNHVVSYTFEENRFIRDSFQYGPVGNVDSLNPLAVVGSSNVWDDDSLPWNEEDTWSSTFATRDIPGAITSWYEDRVGHDPDLDYISHEGSNLVINENWLNSNNGNGRVRFENGRWYVERYRYTATLRIAHHNITFRNMWGDSSGALYSAQSREVDGNARGIIFENCTFDGNGANDNGATLNFPAAREPNQIVFRFCRFSGYRAGIYCFGGITAEYCQVKDLHYSTGSHNTGASIRAGNVTLKRNLITDGNSSAISFYPEHGPYTGHLVEENILWQPHDDVGPEILIASNREYSELLPGQSRRVIGNLFYKGGNRGENGGFGSHTYLFSEVRDNVDRLGEAVG